MLSVTSIESCVVHQLKCAATIKSCVVCDKYRNLALSVASIEYCVVCDKYRNLVLSEASIVIFVFSVASIESCVV